jgi:hypothetical protein
MKSNVKILILLLILSNVLASCKRKTIVYYSHENVVITRIDKGKNTFFYTGHIKRENIFNSKPSVIVD